MSTEQNNAETNRLSVWSKLYRGETDFQFVASRKRWYLGSAIVIAACIVIMLIRGFTLGIDFAGGNQYTVPTGGSTITDVENAAAGAGADVASGQIAGVGQDQTFVIRTAELDGDTSQAVRQAMADEVGVSSDQISVSEVSATWGAAVSQQALIALVVFLFLITVFIWLRFERRMAIAALAALGHDLVLTAGIFSLVGFEVTPSTMVGMLTILAYSLYDTVVVFDKVQENTANLLQTRRQTFAEGVNEAVNETLMRSLNTSLIGALPVGALLFIGVGMLGVGTLKDLALVLFVGIVTGTYSSVFLAAPWVVDMAERHPVYKKHNQKVANKRSGGTDEGDEDDDRLRTAKTNEVPLELLEETTASVGAPSSSPSRPQQRRKKRR
ncbi:protein translocase subunit SecF [Glycomyces sp. L485]|uniref:protein translocase subunit SecF n=1 Tax=Glycomyces sp. L485 TaxID=2909235 RepID=UPI001F4B0DDD|nr:protein translocase subunit SecF [Glycomyces sp. L485]MCH7229843.1 protein translocase subunit SecF [Glycomyces sp. L485]